MRNPNDQEGGPSGLGIAVTVDKVGRPKTPLPRGSRAATKRSDAEEEAEIVPATTVWKGIHPDIAIEDVTDQSEERHQAMKQAPPETGSAFNVRIWLRGASAERKDQGAREAQPELHLGRHVPLPASIPTGDTPRPEIHG